MARRLLIIDDDPDILDLLSIIFEQEGFEVIISETGEETNELDLIKPDLILLDIRINIGGKNGATVCALLKSQAETLKYPVVLISAERDIKLIANQCGADDYILKPFDIRQICDKIKGLLITA